MSIDDVVGGSTGKGLWSTITGTTKDIIKEVFTYKAWRVAAKTAAMAVGGYIGYGAAYTYKKIGAFIGVATGYLAAKIVVSIPSHIAEGIDIVKKVYNAFAGDSKPAYAH